MAAWTARAGRMGAERPRRAGGVRPAGAVLLAAALAAFPAGARAQIALHQRDSLSLELSGYVRSLTAFQDRGFDLPGIDRQSAFNGEVVRVKLAGRWGESVLVQVHDRLQALFVSGDTALGTVAGFGVSAVPGRTLDLSIDLVRGEQTRVWNDIDRLAVTFYTGAADITLGRQAITWGTATLFPIADLWAQFSPFELDTEEKPGIDAARALLYPDDATELDAVIADGGSWRDLSAGIRASRSFERADAYAAFGKFWRELIAIGGASLLFDKVKLRAEAAIPWDLDDAGFDRPRATLGADWIGARLQLSAEYHYNGIGAGDDDGYLDQLQDPRFLRGESYYLGRHYLGALAAYAATDRLALSTSTLVNLRDPSAAILPDATYDLGQAVRISVGGLFSLGAAPRPAQRFPVPLELPTEFGAYGDMAYARVSFYF